MSLAKGPGEGGPRPPGVQRPFNRCWLHERRKPSIWTSSKAAEREGQAPRRILRKLPALPASRDEKWTGWPRRRNRLRLPEPRCGGDCQHPCPSTSRRSGLLGMPGALAGEEGWRPTNYHFGCSSSSMGHRVSPVPLLPAPRSWLRPALRRVVHSSRALLCLSRTAPPAASQWTISSTLIP